MKHPENHGFDTNYKIFGGNSPLPFSEIRLNDLARNAGLSKETANYWAPILEKINYWPKKPHFLETGIELSQRIYRILVKNFDVRREKMDIVFDINISTPNNNKISENLFCIF